MKTQVFSSRLRPFENLGSLPSGLLPFNNNNNKSKT